MSGANTIAPLQSLQGLVYDSPSIAQFAGNSYERDCKLCEVALRMKPEWAKTLGLGFLMNEMN